MHKLIKKRITLSNADMDHLLALLKSPPLPNAALIKAYKEYLAHKKTSG